MLSAAHIQSNKRFFALSFLFLLTFCVVGYFVPRHDTGLLLSSFALLFLFYYIIYTSTREGEITTWLLVAVLIRGSLLFAVPQLSDDFYRFIWDGRLLYNDIHPFAEIPSYYMQEGNAVPGLTSELFHRLNSPEYFTIYPPITQFIFWLSVALSPNSIFGSMLVLKVLVVLAEVGSIALIKSLLAHFELPGKKSLLYALNPLVILELSGNLHFEAFVIFFLLGSIYMLLKQRLIVSAVLFTLAVHVKLLPLIFLPSLLPFLGLKKTFQFYLIVSITSIILFAPLLNMTLLSGMNESLSYYFKKFEFNASFYYLIREWGFWKYGYNIIQTAGWKLALVSTTLILLFSLRNMFSKSVMSIQELFTEWIIILTLYLFFTTTVHPWYIVPLLAFSVFSNVRYPLVWSGLILITYAGYTLNAYQENLWLVLIEYVAVLAFMYFDFRKRKFSFT